MKGTVYLHDASTHRVIASHWSHGYGSREACWAWFQQAIANEYGCSPDEVGCVDTEDRFDNVTVPGHGIVAYTERN